MSSNTTKWRKFAKPIRNLGLQVGEKIYWVSRRRLASLSPVFKSMLYGEFQESKEEIVKLSDKEPRDILEMLRCLFPTRDQYARLKTKSIDDQNVVVMLKLADEYEINVLMEKCSTFLERRMVGTCMEKVIELIDLANQYHLKSVIRVGLRCLSKCDPSILLSKPEFMYLPINMRLAVATIAWFREFRPSPSHEYLGESDEDDWPDDWSDLSCTCTRRCKYCKHEKCSGSSEDRRGRCYYHSSWHNDEDVECDPICHTCNQEYGSTDFVCKCVDPTIVIELEKLGL